MESKNDPQQVFVAPKVHTKARSIRLIIEVFFLVFLLVGTFFTLLAPGRFSVVGGLEKLKVLVSVKRQNFQTKIPSFEESARSLIDKKLLNITAIEKSPEGFLTIQSKEGVVVLLSAQKDLESQVRTLQTLLSKAKIEGKTISSVDFRFEKLVVRYK